MDVTIFHNNTPVKQSSMSTAGIPYFGNIPVPIQQSQTHSLSRDPSIASGQFTGSIFGSNYSSGIVSAHRNVDSRH